MRSNFAIIGGGLTATAMLYQLVNRVREKAADGQLDPAKIDVEVFEKQDHFGPGFPHSDRFALPFHITNMCASDMGILYDNPRDFQDWVTDNFCSLQKRFVWFHDACLEMGGVGKKCNHYPRAVMGEYLKTRFQEAVQLGREIGLTVRLYPKTEVIDLRHDDHMVRMRFKDLLSGDIFSSVADRVLLATGHWFEKNDKDRYFASPWPANKLDRNIPDGVKVAVIGTSLSAIETLLTLTSKGKFIRSKGSKLIYVPPEDTRKFVLYSRTGLLPKVRGKLGRYKNAFLNRENLTRLLSENCGNLTLDVIFKLLNTELEKAYGRRIDWDEILNPTGKPPDLLRAYLDDAINGDGPQGEIIWQTVLYQSFDMIREVYLNLTFENRRRFDKHFTALFFTHAATQPRVNAEKLLALMNAGIVEVIKLGFDYRLHKNNDRDRYEFIYRDSGGNLKRDAHRYVVNARGQQRSFETNPTALAKNLLSTGTVQIEEFRRTDQPAQFAHDTDPEPDTISRVYKTGSIWIDPETHHIMSGGSEKRVARSNTVYAVGAMTRGQILDASMARGIVLATSRIADDLTDYLIRRAQK